MDMNILFFAFKPNLYNIQYGHLKKQSQSTDENEFDRIYISEGAVVHPPWA